MGQVFSRYFTFYPNRVTSGISTFISRKRKCEIDTENELESAFDMSFNTPKRRKLMTTSRYIYSTLFEKGTKSDVTLIALDRRWPLHKVYLCQSRYFACMFSGAWSESQEDTINIQIVDQRITLDAMRTVLGSLYADEIELEPVNVIPVLATATLFQVDGVIEQCQQIMIETINVETVVAYYEAADEYALGEVKRLAYNWLLHNLMSTLAANGRKLKKIGTNLMADLVSDPGLFVVQTEFSLYGMLRAWLYLNVNPRATVPASLTQIYNFFRVNGSSTKPYLLTAEGQKYISAFQALRYRYLITHYLDYEILCEDSIVDLEWIKPPAYNSWLYLLRIEHGVDRGPQKVDEGVFERECQRCCRVLRNASDCCWRWTGFNFGLDLIWVVGQRSIKVKRNTYTDRDNMISFVGRRYVYFKLVLFSLDEQKVLQRTALERFAFRKNEEVILMELENNLRFPIMVSVNSLTVSSKVL